MIRVKVGGKELKLDPAKSVGKGGEADIFNVGKGIALKLFKTPDHPDVKGSKNEEAAAERRITEHQRKLRDFPKALPDRIITPLELVFDNSGKIAGYTMRFVENAEVMFLYGERRFRENSGIDDNLVTQILLDLWETVEKVHLGKVIIGDFNDLNVLIRNKGAYLIDADSFQYGGYLCKTYTNKFVDPLICDKKAKRPEMIAPHTELTDWYAYTIMVMQNLLFVGPYGGVHQPKKGMMVPLDARSLNRITVFSPDVIYPKPARHFSLLPDDLLHFFDKTFVHDLRGTFPKNLLERFHWQKCTNCGVMHARNNCPACATAAPGIIREVEVIRGKVKATRLFSTNGVLLRAVIQNGNLLYLYHERERYLREREVEVKKGKLLPGQLYALSREKTFIGKTGEILTYEPGKPDQIICADGYVDSPNLDANVDGKFWTSGGNLYRDGRFGHEIIGQVLPNQTKTWVGNNFGFGFYRAGAIFQSFVFDTTGRTINDSVKLPKITGQIIDTSCSFSPELCWFFITLQDGKETKNRVFVINRLGKLIAESETLFDDGSWLGKIHGRCALGNSILSATDSGIVRAEISGNLISAVKSFPDTEPFVDSETILLPASGGLYAIKQREIIKLEIS